MNASRHSKSDVLQAAMKLLDEVGLPDLTMRKLAATLDVQPSALYWHFANKQSLLAEVSNTIVNFAKPVSEANRSGAARCTSRFPRRRRGSFQHPGSWSGSRKCPSQNRIVCSDFEPATRSGGSAVDPVSSAGSGVARAAANAG